MATSIRHSARQEMRGEMERRMQALKPPPVLVVDDDYDIRETLRIALEEEGYEVDEAEDGAQALSMLRTSPQPSIVLLDLRLPRLNGDALLRRVERKEHLPAPHIFVLVTANRELLSPMSLRLLQRMDAEVIAKPFDLNVLLDLVAQAAQSLDRNAS